MEKIEQLFSKDSTFSALTPALLSIYGFLFITYVNRTHTIQEVNQFILTKQNAIYLTAFPDLISIPLINLYPKFWTLPKIIAIKGLLLLVISLIMFHLWTPIIIILTICLTIYGAMNLYYIKKNRYKELFHFHFIGIAISIPLIILLDYLFEVNAIVLFGISNLLISIILIIRAFTQGPVKIDKHSITKAPDFKKISILLISSVILPLLVNQYILDFKTVFSDKLYYLEYYFMLSSVFATVVISPQLNLIFTQDFIPKTRDNLILFSFWIISSLSFLFVLKFINDQDVEYINFNLLIFLLSDFLRIVIFLNSRKYILKQEFHILLIFEMVSYFIVIWMLQFLQALALFTYALIPLFSLLLIFIRKNGEKKSFSNLE